jgi:hypothetical protein
VEKIESRVRGFRVRGVGEVWEVGGFREVLGFEVVWEFLEKAKYVPNKKIKRMIPAIVR